MKDKLSRRNFVRSGAMVAGRFAAPKGLFALSQQGRSEAHHLLFG